MDELIKFREIHYASLMFRHTTHRISAHLQKPERMTIDKKFV